MLALAVVVAATTPAWAAKPPPDTIIDSGPAAQTNSTSASFTFHSTGQGATYSCRLDGGASAACSSPVAYANLAAGSHVFSVVSTAGGLTDTSPATMTWTIDVTPPTAPTGLAATTPSANSVALSWHAGTDNVGVTNNQIVRDGAVIATVGAVTSYTDSTVTSGSTHTYVVRAVDGAQNLSPSSDPVTATTPSINMVIDSGPAALTNSTTATFAFHSSPAASTFTCKLDTAKAGACSSPRNYQGLSDGQHTFSVFATVNGVGDSAPATASWTVDTTPPTTPTNLTTTTTTTSVTVGWAASTDMTGVTGYDVFRNGALLASVGAVTTYADTTILAGKTYSYAVRAHDGAGNTSALSLPVVATPIANYDPHLTRAPYLTDLVGLHVAINYATDQSDTTGSIQYGAVGADGSCAPTTVLAATRKTILVGTVYEYQWLGDLTVPAGGAYCYRVYLGSTDLLGANTSPTFVTQEPVGSTSSFSFDVFGDWGQVDVTGQNADQANLMSQIAASGARFAVTVGDNGYPNGSQINYGDLQQAGASTSAIFGPDMWTVPGDSLPLFSAVGNHGVSGTQHTDISTWTQNTAVTTSGGRYQNDLYCCVNGSNPSNYGSEWYAFSAGNTRFYILDSAWGDTNAGTATPYANDALAHFVPGDPEYDWLLSDLETHPTQLKFAFSHFPFYSDNTSQPGDTYLQGATNLEGVLGQHGVQIVFNGHAHIYERNRPSASGMPITYVTGGGGATLEPIGPTCNTYDAYGIGWSPTKLQGTACGRAAAPTAAAQVFHFLKVTVSGTSVTVTPTDSTGRTFDTQTYAFKVPTDTYIDSAPPAGTTSTTATFTFHASGSPATFSCRLDNGTATACTSPVTYTGLLEGAHTFSVAASYNRSTDPTPARATWTVDTTPPTAPTGLTATASSPFTVDLAWTGATDNTGVTGYDIYRDGSLYESLDAVTSYTDAVLGGSTHQYAVLARDIAGNVSTLSASVSVTTLPPPSPVFADGFESGDFTAWNSHSGLVVESSTINSGTEAAEGNTTNGGTYAKKTLPATYQDAYARVWFNVLAQPSQVNLLRLRDAGGQSLGYVYIETTGQLGYHNDAAGTNTLSDLAPSPGWHALELHLKIDTTGGIVEIWLDNSLVSDLSSDGLNTGTAPVGAMQIGEVQTGLTYDVAFDDVAFGTSRLGPAADASAPTVPTGVTAAATSPFSADISWNASTDDIGIAGYDVFRDGVLVASLGNVLTWTDTATLAGTTHQYAVRARDTSGNVSTLSDPVSVTQPAAAAPVFSDGFETGDLSGWTSSSGLVVQAASVHSGGYAAEANPAGAAAYAKKTLPSTYSDAYARVAFDVNSQSSQVTLLRLRDTPTGNGGYLYLTPAGRLAFRSDALPSATVSAVSPGAGWHALELHLAVNGADSSVEVWLDGAAVPDLTFASIDLGTAPIGVLQVGDTATGTWDIAFDDAAFGTSRLGPTGDTNAPSVPANLLGAASSPFSVDLSWDASADDVGVIGYDVFRDGLLLERLGTVTAYTDNTVLAGTSYTYAVRARDAAGNVSPLSQPVIVGTPAAAAPLFSDGFETGDLSAWTTKAGLVAENVDAASGTWAVEGNTTTGATYAKKTLPSAYDDAYARVAFKVQSQVSQINLLRLRDSASTSVGYVYLNTSGRLGLHVDAAASDVVSAVAPGSGWHTVELHFDIAAGAVDVWLDGTSVASLSSSGVNLGTTQIGGLQIGETTTGRTYDVLLDDAAFGTSRLGI